MKKRKLALILAASLTIMSVSQQQIQAAAWKKDNTGWWYQEDNGTYTKSKWKKIGSEWYWFDTNGYMAVGWKKINNSWYYFKSDGAMLGKGWHKIGSSYYYMYDSCLMAQNTWIGNEYVDANGVWIQGKTKYVQGWKKSGTRWWYCHKDGSYTKNGWEKINGKYYYFDASGYMLTGWKKANGVWYYLKSDGAMMNSGWLKIKGQWYYFREDGSMMGAGWHKIKGSYYYMNVDGDLATNTWIGDYYVNADGVWNKTVTAKQKAYKAYSKLIANYESMYGTAKKIEKSAWYSYMTGLCFMKLVDFGGTGNEQLFLVYRSDNTYKFEVWNWSSNQLALQDSGSLFLTDGGQATIILADYANKSYIETGSVDDFNEIYFHGYNGTNFGVQKTFLYDGVSKYKIDQKSVSYSVYEKELNKWTKSRTEYCLKYQCDSDSIAKVNKQTKQALASAK